MPAKLRQALGLKADDPLIAETKPEGRLLRLLAEGGHECRADAFVAAEARRNLEFKGSQAVQTLDALLGHLRIATVRSPTGGATAARVTAWLPEKDRPVLAAAMALGCDALVTGDRTHFGAGYGRAFGGVTIHSPRLLAGHVLAGG